MQGIKSEKMDDPFLFSIICVFNNENTLNEYLLPGLEHQSLQHEKIFINNSMGIYPSAAIAYNKAAEMAKGSFLIFIHQDCYLSSETFLEQCRYYISELSDMGIAGVAGKRPENRYVISNIFHGSPPGRAGHTITSPEVVQTLDECLIIIPKSLFSKVRFDEDTCRGWHLYAVDYCLTTRRLGYSSYVLPVKIYHASNGDSLNYSYLLTMKRLIQKHKEENLVISTTMSNFYGNIPFLLQILRFYFFWLIYQSLFFIRKKEPDYDK